MPNWVFNTVVFTGAPNDIDRLESDLKSPEWCLSFDKVIPRPPEEDGDWYSWNTSNWGTKWDANNAECERHCDTQQHITYRFSTAWSPPVPIFEALAVKYPTLELEIHFEEEQGWGGELVGRQGALELVKEWDVPNSHSDHAERGNSCYCESYELDSHLDFAYDDCMEILLVRLGITLTDPELHALNALRHEWEGTFGDLIAACQRLVTESLSL